MINNGQQLTNKRLLNKLVLLESIDSNRCYYYFNFDYRRIYNTLYYKWNSSVG